jgi:hypothetical protein
MNGRIESTDRVIAEAGGEPFVEDDLSDEALDRQAGPGGVPPICLFCWNE